MSSRDPAAPSRESLRARKVEIDEQRFQHGHSAQDIAVSYSALLTHYDAALADAEQLVQEWKDAAHDNLKVSGAISEERDQLADRVAELVSQVATLRDMLWKVWDSVPASYDEQDPMVQRHAKALNAIPIVLEMTKP